MRGRIGDSVRELKGRCDEEGDGEGRGEDVDVRWLVDEILRVGGGDVEG